MISRVSIVYAADENNGIGYHGRLPWEGKLQGELARFRDLTMGHPIIMGRKTHESIGRALPGRHNIVLSQQLDYQARDCTVACSLEQALRLTVDEPEVFVIGGAAVYAVALSIADRLYRTEVLGVFNADTFFPAREGRYWQFQSSEFHEAELPGHYNYQVVVEDRIQ